jgi:hypothetical protein
VLGQHHSQLTATPLRIQGARLQGVLIDEPIEVLFQLAGELGRSTGARAIDQPPRALVRKAMAPLAQGGIGKVQRIGDGLEALAFDDLAHGLGTAKDTSLCGLFQESVSSGEGVIGKVQFEGAHARGLQNKVLQKCTNMAPNIR